jgi:hypothetical protein
VSYRPLKRSSLPKVRAHLENIFISRKFTETFL